MKVPDTSLILLFLAKSVVMTQVLLAWHSFCIIAGGVLTSGAAAFLSESHTFLNNKKQQKISSVYHDNDQNRKSRMICERKMTLEGSAEQEESTAAVPFRDDDEHLLKIGAGIRDTVDQYDTYLLDMWGVMHDGHETYEGVLDAIQKLRDAGKELVIISNSSQRKERSIGNLKRLGFDASADFEQIITSGEVAYELLKSFSGWSVLEELKQRKTDQDGTFEPSVFVYGSGAGDEEYCTSCGWKLASVEDADIILARGTFTINDGHTVIDKNENRDIYEEQLQSTLQKAAKRRIPMLVSNPDKIRPDVDRPPMPGHIADLYEAVLQQSESTATNKGKSLVKRVGKPFPEVYDMALGKNHIDNVDLSRVCMVGDALETDIVGGTMAGIGTMWILKDGIHGPDIMSRNPNNLGEGATAVLKNFHKNSNNTYAKGTIPVPTVVLPHFRW